MIFYFSGTGNSLYAAKKIAAYQEEQLISIAAEMKKKSAVYSYTLKPGEKIGFVFPVYAWGPPEMIVRFIEKLSLKNYSSQYIFTIITCADEIGNAVNTIRKKLQSRRMQLSGGFALPMPNNYILMGDVDTPCHEQKKLVSADSRLEKINSIIAQNRAGEYDIETGLMAAFLTNVINPIYCEVGKNAKKFYVTSACTACGICEKVCNGDNIRMQGRPVWGKKCTHCLACLHYCPVHAVQYGEGTLKKGRYTNPEIKISEMFK